MGNSEPLNYNYLRKNFPELAEEYDSLYPKQNIPSLRNKGDRYLGIFDHYDSLSGPLWRYLLKYDRGGNLQGNGVFNQLYSILNNTNRVPLSRSEQRAIDYTDAIRRQKINFADYISSLREGARNLSPEELNAYRARPLTGASDDGYKKRYNMLTKVLGMDKSTVLNPEMQKTIDTAEDKYNKLMKAESDKWNSTVAGYQAKIKELSDRAKDTSLSPTERKNLTTEAAMYRLALSNYKQEMKRKAPSIINKIKEKAGMTGSTIGKAVASQMQANANFVDRLNDAKNSKNVIGKNVIGKTVIVPRDAESDVAAILTPGEKFKNRVVQPIGKAVETGVDTAKSRIQAASRTLSDWMKPLKSMGKDISNWYNNSGKDS